MHRALQYMIISVCLMVIGIQAYSHNEQGCLTWEIRRNRLILTCRLTNLSKQVYLIDNHEQEYIRCTLKEQINSCISPHASQSIFVNSSINTITLTIRKIDEHNFDGKWKCKQGNNAYETEVSAEKGIISATDIHLNGEILKTGTAKTVKLKCHSCREPRHNYAEFLINGTSTDGISYNKTIDKCSNQYGECKPHVCSCHRSGNAFINIFNVTNVFGTYYSCEMRFNDNDKKSIFSIERTVYVNDTVFFISSEMKLIKPPSKRNDRKIKTVEPCKLNEKEKMFDIVPGKKCTKPAHKGNDKNRRTEDTDMAWTWFQKGSLLVAVLTFPTIMFIHCVCCPFIDKGTGTLQKHGDKNRPLPGKEVSTNLGPEGNTDAGIYMTFPLYDINVEEAIITSVEQTPETDADTSQKNGNRMSKQSENNFEEQKEETIEADDLLENTQHEIGNEFIYTRGTERKDNLNEILHVCQPCGKTSIHVPASYSCQNCKEDVCECCKENHLPSHTFEKISSPLVLIQLSNWCGYHDDKEFQFVCKDHNSLCCVNCMLVDHRDCHNIAHIVDASRGFKSHKVFDKYKKFLKTISTSFGNLKKFLINGENDVKERTYNHQSEIERNLHRFVEISQQKSLKEKFLEKVKNNRTTCLLELQKQISIVTKCKTDIYTIETSFQRIWEQLPEEKLFLMVHLSIKFLESTWKKAISDSESINLVFTRMKVGSKYELFETHKKVLPQNLLPLLVQQELDENGIQHGINSFPQFY